MSKRGPGGVGRRQWFGIGEECSNWRKHWHEAFVAQKEGTKSWSDGRGPRTRQSGRPIPSSLTGEAGLEH